jgi:SAM-dependent methyltransferase
VPDAPIQFHDQRPDDLRTAGPGHRLQFIVKALPAGLERLAGDMRVPPDGRVLDYGCADVPYRRLFPATAEYVAADLPGNPHATLELGADGGVPLDDESVDAVISTQVLEHVTDPSHYLRECFRVLKPGGRMLLSTHGLMVYHPDPDDYWRWTCAGLRRAVDLSGFRIVRFEGIMGLAASGLQLVQDALFYRLPRPLRPVWALVLQSLAALADRFESAESRAQNALVFALVAEKP